MNEIPVTRSPKHEWKKVLRWLGLTILCLYCLLLISGLFFTTRTEWPAFAAGGFAFVAALTLVGFAIVLFIRWLCCWRNFKRFLFGLACLITLIALFYAVENFRGKRAWEKYKLAGEAQGETFDFTSIVPPPVPDDQNFAMQPIWVEEISGIMGMEKARTWYGDKVAALGHTNPVRSLELSIELYGRQREQTNRTGNWQIAEKTDLAIWQTYYRHLATITNHFPVAAEPQKPATDVLLALSRYDAAIEQLRAASKLPHARFPVRYNEDNLANILLPHLACLKGITTTLKLRAVAELQANQTDQALEDIKLMSRLHDAIRAEPILISHLVCIAMLQIQLQPIWEGLADHRWNEAQLIALDAELGKLDFLDAYHFAMRAERAFGCGIVDYLRRNRREFASMGWDLDEINTPTQNPAQTFAAYAIPSGWFEQNKISICQLQAGFFSPIINLQTRTYAAPNVTDADGIYNKRLTSSHPYNWFARWLLPALQNAAKKFVQGQAATDFARVAIALERHRLAHGQFPETLDALAPKFIAKIPHDIITGQPLKYRRTDDGNFVLYSVGWNETDDGGAPALTKSGSADPQNGDWVWTSASK